MSKITVKKYISKITRLLLLIVFIFYMNVSIYASDKDQIHKLIFNRNITNDTYSLLENSLLIYDSEYDSLGISIDDNASEADFIMTIDSSAQKSLFVFAPYYVDSDKIFKESMSLLPIKIKVNLSLIDKLSDEEIVVLILKCLESSKVIDDNLINLQRVQRNLFKSIEDSLNNSELSQYGKYIDSFFQKEQFDFLNLIKEGQKIELNLDDELIKLADFLRKNINDKKIDYLHFVDMIKSSSSFKDSFASMIDSLNSMKFDDLNSIIEKVKDNIQRIQESVNIDFNIKDESKNLLDKIKKIISPQ